MKTQRNRKFIISIAFIVGLLALASLTTTVSADPGHGNGAPNGPAWDSFGRGYGSGMWGYRGHGPRYASPDRYGSLPHGLGMMWGPGNDMPYGGGHNGYGWNNDHAGRYGPGWGNMPGYRPGSGWRDTFGRMLGWMWHW